LLRDRRRWFQLVNNVPQWQPLGIAFLAVKCVSGDHTRIPHGAQLANRERAFGFAVLGDVEAHVVLLTLTIEPPVPGLFKRGFGWSWLGPLSIGCANDVVLQGGHQSGGIPVATKHALARARGRAMFCVRSS